MRAGGGGEGSVQFKIERNRFLFATYLGLEDRQQRAQSHHVERCSVRNRRRVVAVVGVGGGVRRRRRQQLLLVLERLISLRSMSDDRSMLINSSVVNQTLASYLCALLHSIGRQRFQLCDNRDAVT